MSSNAKVVLFNKPFQVLEIELPLKVNVAAIINTINGPITHAISDEPKGGVADVRCHTSHLSVSAFCNGNFYPASRDRLSKAYGRIPRPH